MLRKDEDDVVELECPVCGSVARVTEAEAEAGEVRCPRGHTFTVMGMLDAVPAKTHDRPR